MGRAARPPLGRRVHAPVVGSTPKQRRLWPVQQSARAAHTSRTGAAASDG